MAISQVYVNSATISTTEYNLPTNNTSIGAVTDDGVYQVFLDLSALTNTESYELKIYEKVQAAGTQRVCHHATITFAQGSEPVYASPALILIHGWTVTLKKLAGTDRAIEWSIRKIA